MPPRKITVCLTLDPSIVARLDATAAHFRLSRSAAVERLLDTYLLLADEEPVLIAAGQRARLAATEPATPERSP